MGYAPRANRENHWHEKIDWFQVVGNIAIVIGLAVVVDELDQSRNLVEVQIAAAKMSDIDSREVAKMGEEKGLVRFPYPWALTNNRDG